MQIKSRNIPAELRVLESLNGRMAFLPEVDRQLRNMRDGLAGECRLDLALESVSDCVIQISDFTLARNQLCQIDAVLVSANGIYLLDAKNWSGRHTVGDKGFERLTNDPLDQLKRAEKLFCRMLEYERIPLQVLSRLVFVNPEMTLYGVQPEMPIVLPQQLPEFVSEIKRHAGVLTEWEMRVAQRILAKHSEDNPYRLKVDYTWETVGKGMLCTSCRRLLVEKSHKYMWCPVCQVVESKGAALLRTKAEMDVLFPGCKPEVDRLYRFCGGMVSKRGIFKATRN
ncbi:NERD domain-containing protein [Jeotgalibaca porci]|uniref:NERD domain-containing protein n=1 Tax=Jeotgalibaca porci TaxID=1868793 RepID=A0A6G7WG19_9LACT|nr:nuclease-related domain-containing protein [Jeotgalibaca porci]QIK51196.1 NERD domain-containing protein [Jeotgalibaca porci]